MRDSRTKEDKMKIPIYAENDRLRTENKELKDAIQDLINTWHGRLLHDDVMETHIETALKIVNGG